MNECDPGKEVKMIVPLWSDSSGFELFQSYTDEHEQCNKFLRQSFSSLMDCKRNKFPFKVMS